MQQGNILTFSHLSQFKNITDFNNNIEQWMLDIKTSFTKSELIALKRLIRFSAKVAGVCNAKICTIVSATHKNDGVGISRSTFKRMVIKAKKFGLLAVHEAVRKNGSTSSNVYVFNRFCGQSEPPMEQQLNQHNKTNNLNKTIKHNNIRTEEVNEPTELKDETLDASYVGEHVPAEFVNFVSYFFNDAVKIEEYWKLVIISARKNKVTENILETGITAFKLLVRKAKLGNVKNTYGYFYGTLKKKFKALFLKQSFNSFWDSEGM